MYLPLNIIDKYLDFERTGFIWVHDITDWYNVTSIHDTTQKYNFASTKVRKHDKTDFTVLLFKKKI